MHVINVLTVNNLGGISPRNRLLPKQLLAHPTPTIVPCNDRCAQATVVHFGIDSMTRTDWGVGGGRVERVSQVGVAQRFKVKKNPTITGLQELVTYGLKGVCAYMHHAEVLGKSDAQISQVGGDPHSGRLFNAPRRIRATQRPLPLASQKNRGEWSSDESGQNCIPVLGRARHQLALYFSFGAHVAVCVGWEVDEVHLAAVDRLAYVCLFFPVMFWS